MQINYNFEGNVSIARGLSDTLFSGQFIYDTTQWVLEPSGFFFLPSQFSLVIGPYTFIDTAGFALLRTPDTFLLFDQLHMRSFGNPSAFSSDSEVEVFVNQILMRFTGDFSGRDLGDFHPDFFDTKTLTISAARIEATELVELAFEGSLQPVAVPVPEFGSSFGLLVLGLCFVKFAKRIFQYA